MNADLVLPLEKMTIAEKMDVIERIMDDLSRNSGSVPEIAWHGEVLQERETAVANGTDRFLSLEQAEKRIRERTGRR